LIGLEVKICDSVPKGINAIKTFRIDYVQIENGKLFVRSKTSIWINSKYIELVNKDNT